MKAPQIAQDDLIDVLEMSNKIEKYVLRTLKGYDKNLAISSLISATINYLISQCSSIEEVIFYRNLFVYFLDNSISQIQVKKPEKKTPP